MVLFAPSRLLTLLLVILTRVVSAAGHCMPRRRAVPELDVSPLFWMRTLPSSQSPARR